MPFRYRRAHAANAALALALLALPAGHALAQETAPATSAPAAAAPAPAPSSDTVVATVNGTPVTEADLEIALGELDQQFQRLPQDQRRAAALSAIIEIRVLAAKAVADKLDADPEFQRRLEFLRQRALHSAVIDQEIAAKITDADVRARYDKEIAATPPENEVHARHILVKTKEEAEAIIKELEGGADFQKLANEHTSDPSGKTTGGDLGYFGKGQMVPEFETAAFALDVGAFTKQPVQSQFGWHIILVEDKRAKQPPAFDQVKDQIRQLLLRENYFAMVKAQRAAATVDVTDPALKPALEAIEKAQQ